MIGAIETVYKGYRFRSRLEARWAVFFDELKIEYLYEPEGYVLHDDSKYLPDFFLSDIRGGMWLEIKPIEFSDNSAIKKLEMLCTLTNKQGMLLEGDPVISTIIGGFEIPSDFNSRLSWTIIQNIENGADDFFACDYPYIFCICPWCGKIGVEYDGRGARVCGYREHFDNEESALAAIKHLGHWRADDKCYTGRHPLILSAATKARQSRFEHGELGVL